MKVKLMTSLFLMTAMMTSVHAFEFARDGKASCVLVHSDRMTGLDKQAVDELKTYLEKMTGAEFTVLPESGKKNGPAVYLGNTRAAAEQGIDVSGFQDEEWQILDKGNELYLTGGQPAGIEIDLGGNDHLVPGDVLFQCPPQIFLAGSGRVAVGGIKKVDAQRKCVFDHFLCFCFIQRPVVHGSCLAEAHTADTQLGDLNIRIS